MKTFKNILVVVLITLTTIACKDNTQPEVKTIETEASTAKTLDPNAKYAKAEFGIDGMTCAMGCAKTIEKKIAKMDGVKSATVDFDKRIAMVEYDEAKVTPNSLEEAVTKAGDVYKVKDMKTVDAFSSEKSCKADCKKDCCTDKTNAKKKACADNCKKDCCAKKDKA
ncbi:heavy-metal-associated domain-containing protein [Ichthyenterobacterium magnum]|uniref:Cu+-exporting ATPase n=1 Tax=Ichthyenterobacterium magnum TaxID=1230530 RepID=A0A420DWX0_9FLAO|nr:heavy metal-associated domain-containing protein [Ichthyenterobacterium magnum]RKE98715.1 Cu+-exporting ATPase [Ichthyenterobacterium magnum]